MLAAKTDRPPVIVLGTGITALGTLRILGRGGLVPIIAETSDPLLQRSRWYRGVPAGTLTLGEHTLADWLNALPIDRAVLMPCSDHRVSEVAALPAPLRERFSASVSTARTLERFVDKGHFAGLLRATGTPHPFSKPLSDVRDLGDVPDAIFGSAMLKPRDSQSFIHHFRTKALHVTSRSEAVEQLSRVQEAGFAVILQEYIPGPASQLYFLIDGFIDRMGEGGARSSFDSGCECIRWTSGTAAFMRERALRGGPRRPPSPRLRSLLWTGSFGYRGMFSAEFKLDERDSTFLSCLEVNALRLVVCRFRRSMWRRRLPHGIRRCTGAARAVSVEWLRSSAGSSSIPYGDYFACQELRRRRPAVGSGRGSRSWVGAIQPVFQLRDPMPGTLALLGTMTELVLKRLARVLSPPSPRPT